MRCKKIVPILLPFHGFFIPLRAETENCQYEHAQHKDEYRIRGG